MSNRRNRHAFTLVELLVVIAIISTLAAMLLPTMQEAFRQAEIISCAGQLRQIHFGYMAYADDHNGWGPKYYSLSNTWIGYEADTACMAGYWGNPESLFVCPATTPEAFTGSAGNPGRRTVLRLATSYAMLFGRGGGTTAWFGWQYMAYDAVSAKTPNLRFLGRTITDPTVVSTLYWRRTRVLPQAYLQPMMHDAGRYPSRTWYRLGPGITIPANHAKADRTNILYMDGHLETYFYDEIRSYDTTYGNHVNVPSGWRERNAP